MRHYHLLSILALALLPYLGAPAAEEANDTSEAARPLGEAWRQCTVLSQGPGATPGYHEKQARVVWSYNSGTPNAQQQVLLRTDMLPALNEAVEVRLVPEEYPRGQQDFAGLAFSTAGAALKDRRGLLLFFSEPSANQLRFWYFGDGTDQPTVQHAAAVDLSEADTLVLRLVRVSEEYVRASWSTDGERFHWLPAGQYGPVAAVGLYTGNARNPAGNRVSFEGFQLAAVTSPDCAEDYALTTPSWTHPEVFLGAKTGDGPLDWPVERPEARPGSYWWWPGSAVTKEDLTWNLETYRKAGWGNMHVIGIYGVRDAEDRFIDIFSPKWFEMYNHAVAEAERLGMNIDLTPSSGWRMGGPHVTREHGEQDFAVENGRMVARPNRAEVKRAGPGGQGLAINPYSQAAVEFHLDWFDQRRAEQKGRAPRAYYYDSFENPSNWCPEFLETFRRLRGYRLEEHAETLAGSAEPDAVRRVVCDYRETLSDLLIGRVEHIVRWGEEQGSLLRMQAHGAPANLLDMYAAAGIPETEVFGASKFEIPGFRREPQWIRADRQSDLVNRFASSAAHVAGRKLVISESFTWLRNHFHGALSQIKAESDRLMLNGINGIYYHGTCFAPKETTWPGWLFYASTQANARNSIFRDIPTLNAYITRSQSVLQESQPHHDVLLYWPVYDLWMSGGNRELRYSVHHSDWIDATPCGEAGRWLMDRGYTFDFLSDRQLARTRYEGSTLRTEGGAAYRTILVPAARHMPVETAGQLLELAETGATVVVWRALPRDVPGWGDHAARQEQLGTLFNRLAFDATGVAEVGRGKVVVSDDLETLLDTAAIAREPMVAAGLEFIRRKAPSHVTYFIANHSAESIDAWVALAVPCRAAVLMDPMTARTGVAPLRHVAARAEVYLQMQPGETRVLRAFSENNVDGPAWPFRQPSGETVAVKGTWRVDFVEGGPVLPNDFTTETLSCWTKRDDQESERFAGAARYSITVDLPEAGADGWMLDLGDVRESARVWVNGKPAGMVVAHPFRVDLAGLAKAGANELAVEVTNLSANRIRDLDRRGVPWKKFYDINFVDHMYKRFNASGWEPKPSGLLGPVTLTPYRCVAVEETKDGRGN
jgi:hypothetical protein